MGLRLPLDRLAAPPSAAFFLTFLLVADLLILFFDFWLLTMGLTPNESELRWNLVLVGALSVVSMLWVLGRAVGAWGSAGGPGLVLASYGVLARVWTEHLVLQGGAAPDMMDPGDRPRAMVEVLRATSLLAVALAVAGEIGERRARREGPPWARWGP